MLNRTGGGGRGWGWDACYRGTYSLGEEAGTAPSSSSFNDFCNAELKT